jgi:porin
VDYPKISRLAACMILAASCACYPVLADTIAPPAAPASVDAAQPSPDAAPGPRIRAQGPAADNGPSPITLRLQYTGEAAYNVLGGVHDGGTYLNQVLGQLHIDAGKAFGWTGGSFVLEGYYENADSLDTHYVGAAQDPSLIDTAGVSQFRVYQAYYKQAIGNTNLLIGIYDLETEFGVTRPMDIFFNGAYAWTFTLDQSGLNGPSTYPNTALAFRVRQKLNDQWNVQAAVLDGVPDSLRYPSDNAVIFNKTNGALMIGEIDYTPTRTSKILAGYWDYTGKFPAFNQTNPDGTRRQVFGSDGGYIGGATRIYSQTARRGLDVFANVGFAGPGVNLIDRSLNVGLTYTGLLDDRPFDRAGVAVGIAHSSSAYQQMQLASGNGVKDYETNFELTWRAPINRWLTIQPDIQYWINPGLTPAVKNDLLLLLHFEVSHVFDL